MQNTFIFSKTIFWVFIFCCFTVNVNAQIPPFTKSYIANDGKTHNLSGYFISPYNGNANYPPGYLLISNVDENGEVQGIKVTATDPNGATLWSKFIFNDDSFRVFAITYDDRDNSYLLTGYALMNIGGGPGQGRTLLLKIDSWGNAKWLRGFSTNAAPCANCNTDYAPAYMAGIDILKVQHDPAPNASVNDFVVVGFLTETSYQFIATHFTVSRRNFIWRFTVSLDDDPVITTKYFKTYHGGFYETNSGTFEPTNFDVPISLKEIDGEGFFVTGTTKDTSHSNPQQQGTTYNTTYKPYYGLINYDAGGSVNSGTAFFKYAFFERNVWSRSAVKVLPDYQNDKGYLLVNYNDRGWFEIFPIVLSTGLPFLSPSYAYYYTVDHPDTGRLLVASNIIDYNSNEMIVVGYGIRNWTFFPSLRVAVDPFTIKINKNTFNWTNFFSNKIYSKPYVNYNPLGSTYDFFKTSTVFASQDSMRSVITPVSGISNNFLGSVNDIVITSPHYTTYNGVDSILNQAITLFQDGFIVNCKPETFKCESLSILYSPIDYRAIALVDTITPLIKYTNRVYTLANKYELDCQDFPSLFKTTSLSENIRDKELSIYPNPTVGIINFSNLDWQTAIISDMIGREILKINKATTTLDISRLAPGLYIIDVYKEGNCKKSFKIVRE